nr:hypothetical protein [Tanacetum cinerariifolium]
MNAPLSSSTPSDSFDLQQIAASLEDKLDIRMNRFEKSLNDMKNSFVTPTAPIKAVEEVIAPGMFRINSSKTSKEEKHVPNTVNASNRTTSITVSQPPIIT